MSFRFETGLLVSAAIFATLTAAPAFAFVIPGGPTVVDPVVRTPGPQVPYISGRLGTREAGLPTGGVRPDDFCLPGKLDNCGDHLRDEGPSAFSGAGAVDPTAGLDEDLWAAWADVQVRETEWANDNRTNGATSLAFGIDRQMSDALILGVMGTTLNDKVTDTGAGTVDSANGLMVGPYFVYQTTSALKIDGRLLYGMAEHDVRTAGILTGSYQSQHTFAALRGSAEIERGDWLLFPSLEVSWSNETTDAYTDGVAGAVPSSSATETFLTFGGLGQYQGLGDGGLVPFVGAHGHFDMSNSNVFGSARIGLINNFENGGNFHLEYVESGLGLSGVTDRQLSAGVEVTF